VGVAGGLTRRLFNLRAAPVVRPVGGVASPPGGGGDGDAPKSLNLQATRFHSLAALPEEALQLVLSFLPSAWNRWQELTSDDEARCTGYRSASRRCVGFQQKHQQPLHADALPGEYGCTFDVSEEGLASLRPGIWLKGEVIDKFLSMLCTRNLQGQLLLAIRQRCRELGPVRVFSCWKSSHSSIMKNLS
jgi:hypothetical protein